MWIICQFSQNRIHIFSMSFLRSIHPLANCDSDRIHNTCVIDVDVDSVDLGMIYYTIKMWYDINYARIYTLCYVVSTRV